MVKIEWLNDDYTRAAVTKGWFRKKVAIVYRELGQSWRHAGTEVNVSKAVENALYSAKWKAMAKNAKTIEALKANIEAEHWIPVGTLPTAKLLKG